MASKASSSNSIPSIRVDRFHLATRLQTLFFPVDLDDLLSILDSIGYTGLENVKELLSHVPSGARPRVSAPIAESDDRECSFRTDTERNVIALAGKSIERVIGDFDQITSAIRDQYVPAWDDEVRFHEFILDAEAVVGPGRDPISEIARLAPLRDDTWRKFEDIVGLPVANFGFRLVERGRSPNDNVWTEYKLEPAVSKPNMSYVVHMIHRGPILEHVTHMATGAQSRVAALLEVMQAIDAE